MTDWNEDNIKDAMKKWPLLGFKWTRLLDKKHIDDIVREVNKNVVIDKERLRDDLAVIASDYFDKMESCRDSLSLNKRKNEMLRIHKILQKITSILDDNRGEISSSLAGGSYWNEYGKKDISFDFDHYLTISKDVSTALDYIYKMSEWSLCATVLYRRRIGSNSNTKGTSEQNKWLFGSALWNIYRIHFCSENTIKDKPGISRDSFGNPGGPYFRFAKAFAAKYNLKFAEETIADFIKAPVRARRKAQ